MTIERKEEAKILLMGKSASGKTSIRSVVFAGYRPTYTRGIGPTLDVEQCNVKFLGDLILNIWDCGGQEEFLETYLTEEKQELYINVEVLIYVIDVESKELEKDFCYYKSFLEATRKNSPEPKIFGFVHKMDLIPEEQQELIFRQMEEDLVKLSKPFDCKWFRTSLWDGTLYHAWSSIVKELIPNVQEVEQRLNYLANTIDSDDIILFHKTTFLVISHSRKRQHYDAERFQKISKVMKLLQSRRGVQVQLQTVEIRNADFLCFMDDFTSNTYIMVIMCGTGVASGAIQISIKEFRRHFEALKDTL